MNTVNPYAPRRKPRHRAWRRVFVLTVACLIAMAVALAFATPQESSAPANPAGSAVSPSTVLVSARTGAHSDHEFYGWYT